MTGTQRLVLAGVVAAAVGVGIWSQRETGGEIPSARSTPALPGPTLSEPANGAGRIAELYATRSSDELIEIDARVDRLLRDDRHGSPHQRFIVRLDNGMTLLVAHNIELARRVDVEPGDRVRVRGEYAWNEQGGVIHWTHADPDGDHPAGWIRVLR